MSKDSPDVMKYIMSCVGLGVKFGSLNTSKDISDNSKVRVMYSVPDKFVDTEKDEVLTSTDIMNYTESWYADLMTKLVGKPLDKENFSFSSLVRYGEEFTSEDAKLSYKTIKEKVENVN